MSYLTPKQVDVLLEPIKPHRVGRDGKGFSHVEAYELRAHMNRIFGFALWSEDVLDQQPIFEVEANGKWTVAYRTLVRLTVKAPGGTPLATYTEGATGEAKNQPHRGDAHDLALKTSQSQAFKRCCANLGDSFGLSLYRKGSTDPLVKVTLVRPAGDATKVEGNPQDSAPPSAAESEQAEEPRETTPRRKPSPEPAALDELRTRILAGPPKGVKNPHAHWAQLQLDATKAGVLTAQTADENGEPVTVKALIERQMRGAA